MTAEFSIAGRRIGAGAPVYVIAEVSANHGQDYETAVRLVRGAKDAGADAVKLQTYTPDTITIDSDAPAFRNGTGSLWAGRTLYDLYQEAYTPWEWQPRLKALADDLGIQCFSSPFDPTAVDFLLAMGVPAFKVASFELVDLPLIRRMAQTGKPMIISTGMATEAEVDEAVTAARGAGASQIALLKCTSAYPSPPESVNLLEIPAMRERWGVPVGLSDHTIGETAAVGAVALGAWDRTPTAPRTLPSRWTSTSSRRWFGRSGSPSVRSARRCSNQPRRRPRAGGSAARSLSSRTSPRARP